MAKNGRRRELEGFAKTQWNRREFVYTLYEFLDSQDGNNAIFIINLSRISYMRLLVYVSVKYVLHIKLSQITKRKYRNSVTWVKYKVSYNEI